MVEFILRNTQGGVQAAAAGQYVDPFTGASAYVPPATSGGAGSGGAGGSSSGGGGYAVTGGGADPFTGGGAAPLTHLPAKSYLVYDQVGGLAGRLGWALRPLSVPCFRCFVFWLLAACPHQPTQITHTLSLSLSCPTCRCPAGTASAERLRSLARRWLRAAARPCQTLSWQRAAPWTAC